jgi:hypothetical protein
VLAGNALPTACSASGPFAVTSTQEEGCTNHSFIHSFIHSFVHQCVLLALLLRQHQPIRTALGQCPACTCSACLSNLLPSKGTMCLCARSNSIPPTPCTLLDDTPAEPAPAGLLPQVLPQAAAGFMVCAHAGTRHDAPPSLLHCPPFTPDAPVATAVLLQVHPQPLAALRASANAPTHATPAPQSISNLQCLPWHFAAEGLVTGTSSFTHLCKRTSHRVQGWHGVASHATPAPWPVMTPALPAPNSIVAAGPSAATSSFTPFCKCSNPCHPRTPTDIPAVPAPAASPRQVPPQPPPHPCWH